MAWKPVEISCPSCGETVRADLDAVLPDGGGEEIRGRALACRYCDHEFEILYL
jgi:DNA-directed RNA polymerase subunit RPC12/RpoP